MPQLTLHNQAGERVGQVEAPELVFGAALNRDLIHQALLVVDNQRLRKAGRAKTRGEVRMTSAKMYRQKGLGRARHGNRAAPHFKGGGVAHPPQGDGRMRVMPRKARRAALNSALSDLAKRNRVLVIEELALEAPRTKDMIALLAALRVQGKIILLASSAEARNDSNYKSCRNLPDVILRESPHISTRDALWADYLVLTRGGMQALAGGGTEDA
jgi:large subunit ribosomal protein L4